eukprot:2945165-Amphidinium_carterae.1
MEFRCAVDHGGCQELTVDYKPRREGIRCAASHGCEGDAACKTHTCSESQECGKVCIQSRTCPRYTSRLIWRREDSGADCLCSCRAACKRKGWVTACQLKI